MPSPLLPDTTSAPHAPHAPHVPQATDTTARRVLRQFRLVFSAVRSHTHAVERAAGLGGAAVWAMGVVAQSPGITLGQLALAMDIHQSTASNLLRTLLQAGWVERRQAQHDKRVWALHPMPEGVAHLAHAPAPHSGVLPHALHQLGEPELLELEQHLAQLLTHLGPQDPSAARTPLALHNRQASAHQP